LNDFILKELEANRSKMFRIPKNNSLGLTEAEVEAAIHRFNDTTNLFGGEAGLNGHFWCELPDGTIADDWWDNYDQCRTTMGIKNKNLKYYECSNPITTKVMMKKLEQSIAVMTGDYETSLILFNELWEENGEQSCMFNALSTAQKTGGKVKFGSLGINSDDDAVTFWFSGDDKFSTVADFFAAHNTSRWTIRCKDAARAWAAEQERLLAYSRRYSSQTETAY
jgi:hypothetical protein